MNAISFDKTNALCGAIFIGLGGFFIYQSLNLKLGTAFRMGPGYFPLVLAIVMTLLGVIIFVQSLRMQGEPIGAVAWRGLLFILLAPIFFGFTVRGLGFVPALFFTAFIAAFASHRVKPLLAIALATGITVFSVAVFSYALGLPFQRFGPWLNF